MSRLWLASPVGPLVLEERDGVIVRIDWAAPDAAPPGRAGDGGNAETALLREAAAQLAAWFAGDRKTFELPLAPAGSDFRRRVWAAMAEIPYGETETYGALAGRAGMKAGAARAVGGACGANPIPIVLPCHRVVGANGGAGGYSGGNARKGGVWDGLRTKAALLDIERRNARLL